MTHSLKTKAQVESLPVFENRGYGQGCQVKRSKWADFVASILRKSVGNEGKGLIKVVKRAPSQIDWSCGFMVRWGLWGGRGSVRGRLSCNVCSSRGIIAARKGCAMQELEDRIRRDGIVKAGNVLKVDAFLNHQCDVELFDHMGAEWARLFEGVEINKILTIEASGIGMACIAAQHFGGVPVVFAKKAQSINLDGEQYATTIYSFTKQKEYPVIVGKRFLSEGDKVLIIDDFLANGCALEGLIKICEAAGAEVSGIGIAVEKGFQGGGDKLRERGFRVESLARIADMDCENGEITFA